MKHNLGISTVAIVCVLCTAVSGAYGASSVRSLGGSGTYTSASNAAAAADSNGSASSIRGGSVRVNPTSGVSGTSTTIEAGTTTSGRVATTPRLSIGHYLGGATSVSGGSSLRPTTPSGGTSGGGSTGGGVSGDDFAGLQGRVDQLERDYNDLQGVTDGLTDQIATKQDVLVPGNDGYIIIDNNEIFVDVEPLRDALNIAAGQDGREIELGDDDTNLLWRYVGDSNWNILIPKAEITGPQGERGEKGEPGDAANLDAYSTTEQMNQAIGNAIAALADVYATRDELANYATSYDLTRGLQNTESKFYPKEQTYTKTEVDQNIAAAIAGDSSALDAKADKTYVDEQLAKKADKSELTSVEQLAGSAAATATAASTDATNALAGLEKKEDKLNKKTTLTNSDTDYPSTSAVTAALVDKANVDDIPTTVAELTDASNYVTTTGLDSAIDSAIAEKDFVTSADLEAKADASDVDALGQRVTAAETDIGEINATIGSGELTTREKTVLGAINELKSKTDGIATDGNFEEMNEKITAMESKLDDKQDVANLVQVVSEADTTKYPSGAAVYKELETKANASELDTLEQTVEQLTNAGYVTSDDVNTAVSDALTAVGAVTDANMAEKLDGYATDEEVQNAISTATTDMVTNSTLNTTLSNYATTANLSAKQDKNVGADKNGQILTVGADGDITTSTTIEQSAVNGLTDALDAKADVSALDDYVTNDGLATAVDGALDTAGVVTEESLATKGFVTETQLNKKDYVTNSELATKGYATKADLDGKQDALEYTAENEANKTDDMTVDAGSTTKYPTVHAVEAYVTNTVAEGVDINTDQIDDGAITKPKLHQDLQAEIDGKANTADLGALAEKDQITNDDVADDAAIAKSKLALDVQTALDNAANAVAAPDGEKPANSILGTDGDGNPTWYEIVLE